MYEPVIEFRPFSIKKGIHQLIIKYINISTSYLKHSPQPGASVFPVYVVTSGNTARTTIENVLPVQYLAIHEVSDLWKFFLLAIRCKRYLLYRYYYRFEHQTDSLNYDELLSLTWATLKIRQSQTRNFNTRQWTLWLEYVSCTEVNSF